MKKSLGARTLVYPAPVFLVGAYDAEGRPNIMTAAWGGLCSSKPPSVTVSLRKATYTYDCLMERRAFTVNVSPRSHVAQADAAGMVSGRDGDKFKTLGLTPVKAGAVDAPYVAEFPLHLECSLSHTLEVGLHTMFVGEIRDVLVDESCLDQEGRPDPARIDPVSFAPETRGYYALGELLGQAFSIGRSVLPAKGEGQGG